MDESIIFADVNDYGRVGAADLSRPTRQDRTTDYGYAHQADYEPW
jgi:hypothetical protein